LRLQKQVPVATAAHALCMHHAPASSGPHLDPLAFSTLTSAASQTQSDHLVPRSTLCSALLSQSSSNSCVSFRPNLRIDNPPRSTTALHCTALHCTILRASRCDSSSPSVRSAPPLLSWSWSWNDNLDLIGLLDSGVSAVSVCPSEASSPPPSPFHSP